MKKLLWIGLITTVALLGCSLMDRDFYRTADEFPENGKGILVLILDGSEIATHTLDPTDTDADVLDIEYYTVEGTQGAETLDFANYPVVDPAQLTEGVFTINNLTPGPWVIQVTAYNNDAVYGSTDPPPTKIGMSSEKTINVPPNSGIADSIQIVPLTTPGELSLKIVWPSSAVPTPFVDASLTAVTATGWSTPDISSDAGGFNFGTTDQANYTNDLMPAGYYSLSFDLYANNGTDWIMGDTLSVRIVSGIPTAGTWNLGSLDGSIYLDIDVDLNDPIGIDLTSSDNGDGTFDVLAELQSDPVDWYVYEWFVDGRDAAVRTIPASGETANTTDTYVLDPATLASSLDPVLQSGNHNLSVMVTAKDAAGGSILSVSSETIPFVVP